MDEPKALPSPVTPSVFDVIFKHRRHVEQSPGVGATAQTYALSVIDDIEADLRLAVQSPLAAQEDANDAESLARDGERWEGPTGTLYWSHAKRQWVPEAPRSHTETPKYEPHLPCKPHGVVACLDCHTARLAEREAPLSARATPIESALQAKIDRLMLEYCPEEMTPEQMANWAKHQKPVGNASG